MQPLARLARARRELASRAAAARFGGARALLPEADRSARTRPRAPRRGSRAFRGRRSTRRTRDPGRRTPAPRSERSSRAHPARRTAAAIRRRAASRRPCSPRTTPCLGRRLVVAGFFSSGMYSSGLKRVGDSPSVRWMPTMWRSISAMIFCACSLLAKAGLALRPPSLHTCGSHSDGWIDSGPLTMAARKPSSISRSMQSCGTASDARKPSSASSSASESGSSRARGSVMEVSSGRGGGGTRRGIDHCTPAPVGGLGAVRGCGVALEPARPR